MGYMDFRYDGTRSRLTLIMFTELDDSQYQGVTVNSAYFHLYCHARSGSGDYLMGLADTDWDEMLVTYYRCPDIVESRTESYPSAPGWIVYDVTDWVQDWLDGTRSNYGMVLHDTDDSYNQWVATYSSNYTNDPTRCPKLALEYYGVAVEEATWGQIKAAF